MKVGTGDNISSWYDNWIKNNNLIDIMGLSEESVPNLQAKVCEFIQQHKNENLPILVHTHNNHQEDARDCYSHPQHKRLYWGLNSSGEFSPKFATWVTHDTQPHVILNDISNGHGKLTICPK